ncbi:MAG: hypothetical protein EBT08_10005 [Betaproteobacteria bacterium]|nr:hypothetical protein [Betaproteobacteria bacterium]
MNGVLGGQSTRALQVKRPGASLFPLVQRLEKLLAARALAPVVDEVPVRLTGQQPSPHQGPVEPLPRLPQSAVERLPSRLQNRRPGVAARLSVSPVRAARRVTGQTGTRNGRAGFRPMAL